MRRTARSLAALAAVVAYGLFPTAPAGAAPGPNPEEWWFPSWGIQDKIWPITRGQGVTVAVIDSGIDTRHHALRNRVIATMDFTGGDGGYISLANGSTPFPRISQSPQSRNWPNF